MTAVSLTSVSVGGPTRPPLAGPQRPPRMLTPLRFLRAMQDNLISVWPEEAYARDVTHIRVGRRHMFTANNPALVKHVLLDNAGNYHKSPIARRLFEPALGQGLLTSDGDLWKRHRHLVAPIFAQRRMDALAAAMVQATRDHLRAWDAPDGTVLDLTTALSDLTLDIISRTMFGPESHADVATIAKEAETYQKVLRPSILDFLDAPDWVPRPGMRQARAIGDRLTAAIYRVIARRRASGISRDDLLTVLLQGVARGEVTLREIRDEIATIFTAGHETTASSLGWILYLLDLHPEIEARVAGEVRTVLGRRPPSAADIVDLRFTRMVIDEALRLYPPAHTLTRQALGPDKLGTTVVPKGAVVLLSTWLNHRNPTLWPDPDRFDPDRFDPDRGEGRPSRYTYFPFGAGPRVCVGASFALMEMVLILATILQTRRVHLVPDHPVEPVALITLRPRYGLRATLTDRTV